MAPPADRGLTGRLAIEQGGLVPVWSRLVKRVFSFRKRNKMPSTIYALRYLMVNDDRFPPAPRLAVEPGRSTSGIRETSSKIRPRNPIDEVYDDLVRTAFTSNATADGKIRDFVSISHPTLV